MSLTGIRERSSSVDSPDTTITTPEILSTDDDVWASSGDERPQNAAGSLAREDLLSDLPTIKRQHMTDGYREGLSIGKATVMQKGFDEGYPVGIKIALRVGKVLGYIEGILSCKGLDEDAKESTRKAYEQAKAELAVAALLKDVNDETLMQGTEVPESAEKALRKWEELAFEGPPRSEGNTEARS